LKKYLALLLFSFLIIAGIFAQQSPANSAAENLQSIEMTAKKYEFSPSVIHVKKGARVQLKIKALDRAHGVKIALYPEAAEQDGPPGLLFDSSQEDWRMDKDEVAQVEFVARREGTYPFKCSKFCGLGHGRMKGQLIVDP
jgi:cytochrome c oxidase subunit II